MNAKLFFASLLFGTILSATAQTTSFEVSEGFTLGELNGQKGWTTDGLIPSANALITNNDAADGNNSLQFIGTNNQSIIGAYSPDYTVTDSKITVSQNIFIELKADDTKETSNTFIDVYDVDGADLVLTSSVNFTWNDEIWIITGYESGDLTIKFVDFYQRGQWMNFRVDYDFDADTIKYYLDGKLLYSGVVYEGRQVEKLFYGYDNFDTGFHIDHIQVSPTTLNIKENELASQFSVYPNPATDVINVSNKNAKITGVTLTDLNGRTVKQLSYDNFSNVTVNTADLSTGMYLMHIKSSEGNATKKIIKN